MAGPPLPKIIPKRTCHEHLCNILADLRVIERVESGELRIEKDKSTPKLRPSRDHKGRLATQNQMSRIWDDSFPNGDPRRKVATVHQHLDDNGHPCFSEKYDPKVVTAPTGVRYDLTENACDLCESGDMISPWNRFLYSKYRPASRWHHLLWRRVRIFWGRFRGIMGL
jgi:hypothetical protein